MNFGRRKNCRAWRDGLIPLPLTTCTHRHACMQLFLLLLVFPTDDLRGTEHFIIKASGWRKVSHVQPKPGGLVAFGSQTQDMRVTAVMREGREGLFLVFKCKQHHNPELKLCLKDSSGSCFRYSFQRALFALRNWQYKS